jgi:hypothetical protein
LAVSNNSRRAIERKSGLGYFISLGISMSIVLSILALAFALQPEASAERIQPNLVVEDVYFVLIPSSDDAETGETTVHMSAFITNQGKKDAMAVEVRTFAIDQETNLGANDNKASLGGIPKDTTGEASMSLTVPNGKSYRIELLVFESGKIVVRGSGTVKLTGSTGSAGEDFTTEGPGLTDGDDKADEGGIGSLTSGEAGGSIAAIAALGIVITIIIIIAVVAISRGGEKEEPYVIPKPENNYINNRPTPAENTPSPTPSPLTYKTEV